ncbi:MAG: tripartite tricarboxylate transporter TctB family protein [Pseudomonadota bacterium]
MSRNDHRQGPARPDRMANTIAGLVFAALGGAVVWEAQRFEASGAVTPTFIGICLIALSLGLIAVANLAPRLTPALAAVSGSTRRRAVGGVILALWVAALPHLGFLASAITAFLALALSVPIAGRWTPAAVAGHALAAIVISTGFWLALTQVLGVPLPEARLFQGF